MHEHPFVTAAKFGQLALHLFYRHLHETELVDLMEAELLLDQPVEDSSTQRLGVLVLARLDQPQTHHLLYVGSQDRILVHGEPQKTEKAGG